MKKKNWEISHSKKQRDQTQHFLLLFLKQSNNQKFKIFPLSLSYKDLELGSFKVILNVRKTSIWHMGIQKQVLAPGKSVMFRCQTNEDLEKIQTRGFLPETVQNMKK